MFFIYTKYIFRRASGIYIQKSCNLHFMDSLSFMKQKQFVQNFKHCLFKNLVHGHWQDGKSEISLNVRRNLLICSRHLIRSRAVTTREKKIWKYLNTLMSAQHILSYHLNKYHDFSCVMSSSHIKGSLLVCLCLSIAIAVL